MAREVQPNNSFATLLRSELCNIPFEQWGFFFPCHVAAWRYIRERRPDLLGEINCGYSQEPWFHGTGAEWFVTVVANDPQYLAGIEAIMYPLAAAVASSISRSGCVSQQSLPELDTIGMGMAEEALQRLSEPVDSGA